MIVYVKKYCGWWMVVQDLRSTAPFSVVVSSDDLTRVSIQPQSAQLQPKKKKSHKQTTKMETTKQPEIKNPCIIAKRIVDRSSSSSSIAYSSLTRHNYFWPFHCLIFHLLSQCQIIMIMNTQQAI